MPKTKTYYHLLKKVYISLVKTNNIAFGLRQGFGLSRALWAMPQFMLKTKTSIFYVPLMPYTPKSSRSNVDGTIIEPSPEDLI